MFVGSLYAYFTFDPKFLAFVDKETYLRAQRIRLRLPIVHFVLMAFNSFTGNPRFTQEGIKQLCSFIGLILTIFLIINVSEVMILFPRSDLVWFDINMSGSYIWLEVEWMVFLGTLFSNALFIGLRTCFRHKI
mgnify:CR=1 FL=1